MKLTDLLTQIFKKVQYILFRQYQTKEYIVYNCVIGRRSIDYDLFETQKRAKY